jgi:hypothetical protein
MSRLLNHDPGTASEAAAQVADLLSNDLGLGPEDSIPGLVVAIHRLAGETNTPDQAVDEAIDILSGDVAEWLDGEAYAVV